MYLVHYTYSWMDGESKLYKTIYRNIDAGTKDYAKKKLDEYHEKKGQTVEIVHDITEGI